MWRLIASQLGGGELNLLEVALGLFGHFVTCLAAPQAKSSYEKDYEEVFYGKSRPDNIRVFENTPERF